MDLKNQQMIYPELVKFAEHKRHNILISGVEGCGKTYLAKLYAKELKIEDFQIVESKMSAIKNAIENCMHINTPIVLCIENLDLGVNAVSYAVLKFLEEPSENVYIVVTCRNVKGVPDTILSRCVTLTLSQMAESDLVVYAKEENAVKFLQIYKDSIFWRCAKSVEDVDIMLGLNSNQIEYIKGLQGILTSTEPVYNVIWKLHKFPDGTLTPINIVIKYLMYSTSSNKIFKACHKCLMSLSYSQIGIHAVLAKFVFEVKYMEDK